MKKVFLFSLIAVFVFHSCKKNEEIQEPEFAKREGTAIIITGAAARIAQEVALLEELYVQGKMKDVKFISGVSSGSLNTVFLNAILNNKFSFERFKPILFSLKNDSVFIKSQTDLPVSTAPLKKLLTRVINDTLKFKKISDLPVPSAISVVDFAFLSPGQRTYRLSNKAINDEYDSQIDMIELLMASTAYPFIFAPGRFTDPKTMPNSSYIDGASFDDYVPYAAAIEYEKLVDMGFDTLIIVSRKGSSKAKLSEELTQLGIVDLTVFDANNLSLDNLTDEGFEKGLRRLQEVAPVLAERTYVYVPDFDSNFLVFDFNNMETQYETTKTWAQTHKPILLKDYLAKKK